MTHHRDIRVLAIDPSTRGFGYAILEGPNRLIDWGVKETKTDKQQRSLKLVLNLIEQYEPKLIVAEDYAAKSSRRCQRVTELIDAIAMLASKQNIKVQRISRAEVKQVFAESGAATKYETAQAIANRFPELAPRVPRFRKPWMSEDYRMSIFDAVAFAITFSCWKSEQQAVIRPNRNDLSHHTHSCADLRGSALIGQQAGQDFFSD